MFTGSLFGGATDVGIENANMRSQLATACCNSMILRQNKIMSATDKIQIDLIKLVGGDRLLRLTEPESGLTLEQKLDPLMPVVRQKERLLNIFQAALAKAALPTS